MLARLKALLQAGVVWVLGGFVVLGIFAWGLWERLVAVEDELAEAKDKQAEQIDLTKMEEADHAAQDAVSNYNILRQKYDGRKPPGSSGNA